MIEQHGGCAGLGSAQRQPLPALAAALLARTEAIVHHWAQRVRASLPFAARLNDAQLSDHLPEILARAADALGSPGPDGAGVQSLHVLASRQGMNRFLHDYTVEELLSEGQMLRPVIVEQVEEALGRPLERDEHRALQGAIDTIVQQMTVAHVTRQSHRIREAADAEAKYFSYLSHDLKNNLNGIVLVLESHRRHIQGNPQFAVEFAEDLGELGAAMRSIAATTDGVDRLLKAERLRSGMVQAHRQRIRLGDVMAEVTRQAGKGAVQKGIALHIEVPPEAVVFSDREWVIVVLQNLLGNAIKYSAGGTVRLWAATSPGPQGPRWAVSVSDQGPGIAPEHLAHLFDAFRRGQTHGQDGAGLGLAIAWHAARLLRADLTAESRLGAGATFSLAFPPEPPPGDGTPDGSL